MIERMKYTFLHKAKRILSALLLALLLCASPPLPVLNARADTPSSSAQRTPAPGAYACILAKGTFFYSAADERKGVFLLPESYYVRLVEYGQEYCRVEYQRNEQDGKRLVGYAKTALLTFVDYVPVRPYLYHVFDLTYTIGNGEAESSSFLTEITLSCVYYGDYRVGSETYCYVLRGQEFGYVPKPVGLSFERNTEYEDYLASLTPPPAEKEPEPEQSVSATPAQIAILVVICILVPMLAAFILKPQKRQLYPMEE